ncbi:hypothetical protein C7B67_20035 [filamentous cyanobacterium Phorm 6]|nr:hypothetical protein C7B67_20035 [filamentous cyanobacterium Phorm 6]
MTGYKIEIPVFLQQDKPEIPASTTSTDIITGEIENTYPNLIDNAETASSQNHQPSASEYIVTDTQTIIPEIAVTENQHSQQSENIIADSDNQPPTTIDEYLNTDFDSEKITITPAIPSEENQPENSQNIITDSKTNINEYAIANTEAQPLIGIIDTGFIANNPNIDYSQIILGKDVIDNDNNPLIQPNKGNQHGDTILEIISPSNNQNNSKKAPTIWLARATGSSNWHQSLIEFVDTAKASSQPNAVINLSFDLTQINPDGTETTRYQLTSQEKAALKYAQENNILIVTAAGNQGTLTSALGQASTEYNNIITVGAAENNNRSPYSSYGDGLDILAPTSIPQTIETATTQPKQGTSIAAALITKTISQMWETNPSLNPQQIKNILLKTASDIDIPGWDERTGYGILNPVLAIATATQTIPTTPVLAATKHPTKPLISADENATNTTAKPSSRAALTNATTNQPKTTSTSTGDTNVGTNSYTTEQPQNTTSNTSNYNNTKSTNTQTNRSYSHTNSNWNKSRTNTNSNSNSLYETTTDTNTNTKDYTDKNLSLYSIERTDKSQSSENRLKYEGTVNSQGSYKQKWSSSRNYTSPSQTQKSASESYLNNKTQSDGKHDGNYGESNSKTEEESGSKSTTNNQYTSSNGSSGDNSTTQRKGKTNTTSSYKGNNSNSTNSGENSEVTQSDSHSKTSSGPSKTNNTSDNRSITNNIWDHTTTNGKTVGSSTRDTYSEGNNNSNTSYDDGKSKNKSNTDTYTQNQSQETNSSNGTDYWRNNRDNNYSITSGNNTDTYKNGGDTRNHNRDHYSINKSNSSSSNSAGKPSSKNESESYYENQEQWDSEYKADTYTTKSNSDQSTITASKSNSSTEGNNTTSSNSSDTSRTGNSQTVTTYKDGRKEENGSSTYEKWSSESSYDSKGVVSSISKYSSWTSSYAKSYFKGGYSWSETISGYDSESTTKRAVYTSNGSSWSWTRSGTVWDDGRNDWSESWSKSSWKDGKYLPSESESKRGGFDPKKTTPQVNDVPKFGEPPRLNKVPKNKPIDLHKPPKPSKGIWTPPPRITPPRELENAPDNWFAGAGGGNPPNQDKIQKFLREFRRVMAQGKQAVIDFLKGFIYHSLINGVGILKDVADLLYPPGAKSHAEIEAYYRNNLSFQAGRAVANGLTFLAGILGILLIGLTIGGSGGSVLIAAPAQAAALIAAGNMTAASARDILSLVGQVLQMTSGNSDGSPSVPNPDRTTPSLKPDPNRQPSGSKTKTPAKANAENIRGIARENESAEILSKVGYNVEQNPIVSGSRNPDYKIEARIFDCYAPTTSSPSRIIATLKQKVVNGQSDRFILNLDDTQVSLADIQANLTQYPQTEIKEIIIVRGGTILQFLP